MQDKSTPNTTKYVYVVTMREIEWAWVAGVYTTEQAARDAAQSASTGALGLSIADHYDPGDIRGAHWFAESAVVQVVPMNTSPLYDLMRGDDYPRIATYRYGVDTSTPEYAERYDDHGYPKGGAE